jgi:nucleoside-diphosphate-sugar epimerase
MLPLNGHYAAGNFIRDAIEGHEITVTGDGTQVRSFLYLADLAWWLWVILVNGIPGRAYNVGSDAPVTIGEFAQRVSDTTLPPVPVNILQNPKEGLLAQGQVPSVKRAKEELGLRTRISLTESICRTISWYKDRKILLNQ